MLFVVLVALLTAATTSCSTSKYAQTDNMTPFLNERSNSYEIEADDESLVSTGEVIEISSDEVEEIENIDSNKDVTINIDLSGSREKSASESHILEAEYAKRVEDVFAYKNEPKLTNVHAGKTSKFFKTKNDSLMFYNAETSTVHEARNVGLNVLEQHKLSGPYLGGIAGILGYNGELHTFAGLKAGVNTKLFNVYGWYAFTHGVKNEDDIEPGKWYDSRYWGVRVMWRAIDLTPKGKLLKKLVWEFGVGLSSYSRQLKYQNELDVEIPEGMDVEITYNDVIYQRGNVTMPHVATDIKLRLGYNSGLELGGMFSPWTSEYHKGEATAAKGSHAWDVHASFILFIGNSWKKVNPSVGSTVKRMNRAQRKAYNDRVLSAL